MSDLIGKCQVKCSKQIEIEGLAEFHTTHFEVKFIEVLTKFKLRSILHKQHEQMSCKERAIGHAFKKFDNPFSNQLLLHSFNY